MFNKVFSIDNDKALVEKTLEELKSKPYFQQILDLDFNEGVIRGELYQSPLFDAFGPTPFTFIKVYGDFDILKGNLRISFRLNRLFYVVTAVLASISLIPQYPEMSRSEALVFILIWATLSTLLSIRSGNNLIKTLNKYYSDIWRLHWRRTTTYMIHVRSRSTFGYLFNLNQKRIACHES